MMRILLVEDTDVLRELFARILERSGFDVCQAADGQEALYRIEGFKPDLVLTDLMMPMMDGITLMHYIRSIPGMETVPMLAITAYAGAEVEKKARDAGALDIIIKPIEMRDLLARLDELGKGPTPGLDPSPVSPS